MGRSGSTLLATLLGSAPDVVAPGELCHIWERGVRDNELCSCGDHFSDCAFWTQVGRVAFGGWVHVDPERIIDLAGRVTRHRHICYLRMGRPPWAFRTNIEEFRDLLRRLYLAVAEVSGCAVVVDSSKGATYGCALAYTPALKVKIVHLIRDGRGVAYSFGKRVVRPERIDDRVIMPRLSSFWAGRQWLETNLVFESLRATGMEVTRIYYEDYVRNPQDTLFRLLAPYLGGDNWMPDLLSTSVAPCHSIGGNPMRFHHGVIPIGVDDEWRSRMAPADRRLVEAWSWPLLAAYGYLRGGRLGVES